MTTDHAEEAARNIVVDVAELPDRTSPDGLEGAMLVTASELHAIAKAHVAAAIRAALSSSGEKR
jgi:hypothetical protein